MRQENQAVKIQEYPLPAPCDIIAVEQYNVKEPYKTYFISLAIFVGIFSPYFTHADYTISTLPITTTFIATPAISTALRQYIGDSFTATADGEITSVDSYMGSTVSGSSRPVRAAIYTSDGTLPVTELGATSDYNITLVSNTCTLNTFVFSTPVTVTNGTEYFIVFGNPDNIAGTSVGTCRSENTLGYPPTTDEAEIGSVSGGVWQAVDRSANSYPSDRAIPYEIFVQETVDLCPLVDGVQVSTPCASDCDAPATWDIGLQMCITPPLATSTPYVLTKDEYLFVYGVFLFMLAIPFWARIFNVNV